MQNVKLLLIVLLLLFALPAAADSPEFVEKANKLYQSGDFEGAISGYELALQSGIDNGHLRYNLGNSLYRSKRYGRAIAEYRKALLDIPGDADLRANLELARKQAKDKIDSEASLAESALLRFVPPLNQRTWERLFLTAYLSGWVAALWFVFARVSFARSTAAALLLLSIPFGILSFGTRPGRNGALEFAFTQTARSLRPGVIVAPETKVYSGDGESYQVVFLLHEGAELMTGETRGQWLETLLPDGRRGWIKRKDIDIITTTETEV